MNHSDIRLGTVTPLDKGADYIRQILPHGFESFQLFSWQHLPKIDLQRMAGEIHETLDGKAIISSMGLFGNPMLDEQTVSDFATCIDVAKKYFHCDIVCGFTGAIDGKPLEDSLPTYKKLWGELARRAEDAGVRIAFEHCDMGGTWDRVAWTSHTPAARGKFSLMKSPARRSVWNGSRAIISDPLLIPSRS